MPYIWHPEALKAQAVAARSYALATRKTGGAFDLYPDTRSQVYLGIDHEKPSTNAAVDATAGQVVLYEGQVAKTFFFSTSGGRTASAEDVWGAAVPYLVSVRRPVRLDLAAPRLGTVRLHRREAREDDEDERPRRGPAAASSIRPAGSRR